MFFFVFLCFFFFFLFIFFFFQAEDGIRDLVRSRGLGDVYKRQALGFLLKDATRVQLLQAIRDVAKGLASIQPSIAMKVINEIDNPAELMYTANPLTPRELETLKLIARGLSNQEIASSLVVHERTVAKYVSSILDKLQLANRTQAALYAINEGLAEPKK